MAELEEKPTMEWIDALFNNHRANILALRTAPLNQRKEKLKRLRNWIHSNRSAIHDAMYADFRKPSAEVDGIELFHVLSEIKNAVTNIEVWAHRKKIDAPFTMLGTRSHVRYEPLGVCLIIAPWNYPFSLCIGPLVSALAAGNSVIIKPSELTPHVSTIIKKMVDEIFTDNAVSVCEGGTDVSEYLITLPFDHIFFTGSPSIGKKVMKAAAENLTQVTLELGGKSPAIVTASANLKDAAQRIAASKFVNNGQTCIAPDYVLIEETITSAFIHELINQTKALFTENESFETSPHYARIVNQRHFDRLMSLLQDACDNGAKTELAGKPDREMRFFPPTILSHVAEDSRIMDEEIFGPILPVVSIKNIEAAVTIINNKPKPLALYIFTNQNSVREKVIGETSSGAVCVNDCAIHFLHENIPFGGVNNSGLGKAHGYYGFLAFSNEKPVMKQRSGFTSVKAFYPPYTPFKKKVMNWFLKLF